MKTNSIMNKVKNYLKELTIITIGVLIALFVNNFKENKQAKKYYKTSIETVTNEVDSNYANLKNVIENQTNLLDTISKYSANQITISKLILEKGGGLKVATLNNSGLKFYRKNQINLIDFDIMSKLIRMERSSNIIDMKMGKLIDFVYPNLFADSEKSKQLVVIYLHNVLNIEIQLMQTYEDFIDKYGENKTK